MFKLNVSGKLMSNIFNGPFLNYAFKFCTQS